MRERLGHTTVRERGFLLDGFPRNRAQLDALRSWLHPEALDAAIELAVRSEIVEQRLTTRGRTDDTEAGIAARLGAYEVETSLMLRDLEEAGLLIPVDADRPIDDVTRDILASLARHRAKPPTCLSRSRIGCDRPVVRQSCLAKGCFATFEASPAKDGRGPALQPGRTGRRSCAPMGRAALAGSRGRHAARPRLRAIEREECMEDR